MWGAFHGDVVDLRMDRSCSALPHTILPELTLHFSMRIKAIITILLVVVHKLIMTNSPLIRSLTLSELYAFVLLNISAYLAVMEILVRIPA